MAGRSPETQLPNEIRLTLREAAQVLFALDIAAERTEGDPTDHEQVLAARLMLTSKLWPELGQLLEENDGSAE